MKQHLPWMALLLGLGVGVASVQDIVYWGLDGLNLMLLSIGSLLVYFGGKETME